MKLHQALLLLIFAQLSWVSCKNDDDSSNAIINESPGNFTVTVSRVLGTMASLEWDMASDPNGDSVTYAVWLNGEEIQTGLSETKTTLQGLNAESSYAGKVMASDGKGGFSESVFAFNTIEIAVEWKMLFGGSLSEIARSIRQTDDGGYIVAGYSRSSDGDVGGNIGNWDYWILKLDASGSLVWETNLGGSDGDIASSVQQTGDGGYIVAGRINSSDGDVGGNNGQQDYWIVKLDIAGSMVWETNLGGSDDESAQAVQETTDGGYVAAGSSYSSDGDVNGNKGEEDCWIIKLDGSGDLLWEKNLGGSGIDAANSIQETSDGGYVVAGYSSSSDGDVAQNYGEWDFWILKLDASGDLTWEKNLGGSGFDVANSIQETMDGGYIAAGYSNSSDGDVGHNNGNLDYWIVKLDAVGNLIWETNLGGSESEVANCVRQTSDGGYIVAGFSRSADGDVSDNKGIGDYWITKLDAAGSLVWEISLGGSDSDVAFSVQQTNDGAYVAVGNTLSTDGDVGENNGMQDYWVIKLQ